MATVHTYVKLGRTLKFRCAVLQLVFRFSMLDHCSNSVLPLWDSTRSVPYKVKGERRDWHFVLNRPLST
eukprot:1588953-Amphidinium_carterae.1